MLYCQLKERPLRYRLHAHYAHCRLCLMLVMLHVYYAPCPKCPIPIMLDSYYAPCPLCLMTDILQLNMPYAHYADCQISPMTNMHHADYALSTVCPMSIMLHAHCALRPNAHSKIKSDNRIKTCVNDLIGSEVKCLINHQQECTKIQSHYWARSVLAT